LVLLIGCVNVANLLLARASARGREMALRQALGAAQKRLISQLLTESFLLSLAGGIAGLVILFCAKDFLLRLLPENLPRFNDISISWSVLLFALAASLATGVVFGLAPALHAGRSDLTHALKEAARSSTGSNQQARTRRLLVVTEFALSLVLMIAAGLLLRSFWDLVRVPLGFNPQNVMAVRTRLPAPNDPKIDLYGTPSMRRPVSVKDVFLSCKDVFSFCFLFPSCGFLRIRAGPPLSPSFHPHSWLSDFRSVHGGRSQYSRCCYLIIDLGSRLSTEAGPGLRRSHLISAVELGCVDTISFLYAPFSFFRPFSVFRREISSQDRLATTIANSVDP
jgi:FtsX-like permease family protein